MLKNSRDIIFTDRDKKIQILLILEGSVNLIVCVIKFFVGLSTGSVAILADSLHSLSDIANNIVAWIVIRLSAMPADRKHPYGHRKFETIAIFCLATLLAVLAFEIGQQAITKDTTEIISGYYDIALMSIVLLINISLTIWQHYWAKRLNSGLLLADASHTFADVLTTIVVIIGWQLSVHGFLILDRICALGVSVLIFYLAFRLYKSTFPILIDEYAIDPDEIHAVASSIEGVIEVGPIRSRWKGSEIAIDIVVAVKPEISTVESHKIADKIEAIIEDRFKVCDVLIHIEPHLKNE